MTTTAPTRPEPTPIDKEALRRKYAQERDKRVRTDGDRQYLRASGDLSADPYTPLVERPPVTDHVTVAFIGAGFAGLVTGARLKEAGITDVRLIDKGGDVGGVWYWNRYPGAQCDTASMVYLPMLEETGHMPSEKYVHAPEILEHCQRIAKQYDLYDRALFHTEVTDLVWNETDARWIVSTNRGDRFTAQFVAMGTGPLHVPKLPGIPGLSDFQGHSFHTSRWDYAYTGGDRFGAPMTGLADKRVAIIGTGATSVQAVPYLATACQELLVVQRTPSSVDVRNNRPTDPEWFSQIATPGWQQRWLDNFTANQSGGAADEDLVQDGWTDLARRIRDRIMTLPPEQMTVENMRSAWEDSDFEKMEEIRGRVESVVSDSETADKLKAWYAQLCKRPCFHDEYLLAFNEPSTRLVDTDGKGVERITPRGLVVDGQTYEVDCIIFASGFEVSTDYTGRSGYDLTGRDGRVLSQEWVDGMETLHGTHVHGFPNVFLVQPVQGANLLSNIPHNLTESAKTVAAVVTHALEVGARTVEPTKQAQDAWVEHLLSGPGLMIGGQECTPGYYNNEGVDRGRAGSLYVGYPAGASAYFQYLDAWRSSGDFAGLSFVPG